MVLLGEFPRDSEHSHYRKSFSTNGSGYTTVEVDIDFPEAAKDKTVHFLAFFVDEDVSYDEAQADDLWYLHESDPFVVDTFREEIRRETPPELEGISERETSVYTRRDAEGTFAISVTGRTSGKEWSASYVIYKSAYAAGVRRDHGRSRQEYVSYEMQNGFAGELAHILDDIADDNDITGKPEKVEFVIDFVQRLPYVPDDVSTEYDDYTKFMIETVTELGGDCEDTAILLASVLQSEPFGYDMILIQPPGHMAAGIYGTDLPGAYWTYGGRDYYYIETTGEGWGVGDIPDEYSDDEAYLYQV